MIDEYTGKHGGFEVARSITATAVIDLLENVSWLGGQLSKTPSRRSPHRECHGITGLWSPSTNRLRDELLEDEMFDDPAHVSRCLRLWSKRYDNYYPHSSLGFIPPTEYANQWHHTQEGTQTVRS
ncbi:hypothetical protein I4J37_11890 [Corynebacterium belfantii]|uniref:integrase core domain-containing protein n=1 Tax=Corynebacterium belfantii TaxID=2014537 RepID=UPI0018D2C462|nr:integrase core domain-containing protein [Corynebacterium belfantii]MBG9320384.1 hypothetical protein [Corynebacterium belfantii]